MISRNQLKKYPHLYKILRNIHLMFEWICLFGHRYQYGKEVINSLASFNALNSHIIWYLCVPIHKNLGDYAQYYCIINWIRKHYPNYKLFEIPASPLCYDFVGILNLMKKKIKDNDIIVFQSGYTSTDLHIDETVHRKIASQFKNKIIFFPQTIRYSSKEQLFKTADIYNAHGRILFLARDKLSYEIAKKAFNKIDVYLYPDIVTTLIGNFNATQRERAGVILCLRNDGEKLYKNLDVINVISPICNDKYIIMDTTLKKNENCSFDMIKRYIEIFAKAKLIITDRFHGTIFSLIASTPVIVIKTDDHKVWEGADWFTNQYPDYIRKANSLLDIPTFINELTQKRTVNIEDPYFLKKYYDNLFNLVNKI